MWIEIAILFFFVGQMVSLILTTSLYLEWRDLLYLKYNKPTNTTALSVMAALTLVLSWVSILTFVIPLCYKIRKVQNVQNPDH